MKKYSTIVDTVLLKTTDFSVVNNQIYFKNEQEFWIYTVPSNTIAKLLHVDLQNYSGVLLNTTNSTALFLSGLYLKRPDGLIVPMKFFTLNESSTDFSDKHYYFNEGWSIGVILSKNQFKDETTLPKDLYVNLYFMIEYDSYSEEISERLDSLSSRVTYLENLINTK